MSEGEAKALVSETAEDGCKGIDSAEFTLLSPMQMIIS